MVTRRDLHPGVQASQLVHANTEFAINHPAEFNSWHNISNHVALLSVEDEESLISLANKLSERGLAVSLFQEPDLGNQYTSFTVEACDRARKLTSHLPKAFKEFDSVWAKMKEDMEI
jgi:hypothetical protein